MESHCSHLQEGCTVEEVCSCGALMLMGCLSKVVYVSGVESVGVHMCVRTDGYIPVTVYMCGVANVQGKVVSTLKGEALIQ